MYNRLRILWGAEKSIFACDLNSIITSLEKTFYPLVGISEDQKLAKYSQSKTKRSRYLPQTISDRLTSTAVRLITGRIPVGTMYRSSRFGGANGRSSPFI